MTMTATVIQVGPQSLLVRNEENNEEVLVNFRNSNRFSVGDRIRITFNGQMTFSIPPQITATSIQRLGSISPAPPSPQLRPSEMRAVVLQTGRNFLIVRNTRTGQQMRVEYIHAHHFCIRQQIIVRYDTITMTTPPTVTATDILPVC